MNSGKWVSYSFTSVGVADGPKVVEGVNTLLAGLKPAGHFTGDNLITFGKNLSFLNSKPFMDAFHGAQPDSQEGGLIWRTYMLYWAARQGMTLDGDFVEAGCYRGTSAKIIADAIGIESTGRKYWLYDTFDHPEGSPLRLSHHSPSLQDEVLARFSGYQNIRIVPGWIPDSFSQGMPERISFLHIDMNNVEAEMVVLDAMYDRMAPGGVIVLDDYGYTPYRAQRDAHDAWFAQRGKFVAELPTSQGIVIR